MLASLLLTVASAAPPVPIHGQYQACPNAAAPRVDQSGIIACDITGRSSIRIDPNSLALKTEQTQPDGPDTPALVPPAMMGTVPVVLNEGIAWVSSGLEGRRELWWLNSPSDLPIALDVGHTDPHHPVTDGVRIAWVSDGAIKTFDPETGERTRLEAETGFHSPPTFDNGTLCWEVRSDTDVDILCSDGIHLKRTGHQTRPIRHGSKLFFYEDGRLWVWKVP